VSKHFGALAAVNNLSFDVAEGEVLGIGGPNGAGKTTLFDVISGLNPATGGHGHLRRARHHPLPPEAICHVGIARTFQLNACFDSLSVRDNVRVARLFRARQPPLRRAVGRSRDRSPYPGRRLPPWGWPARMMHRQGRCRCSTASC
jgi:ABC-type branched-subunit amino acid transport system ATPase component